MPSTPANLKLKTKGPAVTAESEQEQPKPAGEPAQSGKQKSASGTDPLLLRNKFITSGAVIVIILGLAGAAWTVTKLGKDIGKDVLVIGGGMPTASWQDLLFIVCVGLSLVLGGKLALGVVHDSDVLRLVQFGYFTAWITVAAACAQSAFLLTANEAPDASITILDLHVSTTTTLFFLAAASAVVMFSAALPAATAALIGMTLTGVRFFKPSISVSNIDPETAISEPLPLLLDDPPPSESDAMGNAAEGTSPEAGRATRQPVDDQSTGSSADDNASVPQQARWLRGYRVPPPPEEHQHRDKRHDRIGICLSAGGIRAASVALGALQAKRLRSEVLPEATYLVSVSGGGYTAGAFQQALTGAQPSTGIHGQVVRKAQKAFLEGSAEEDHIRRHASYLADNPARMLVALGMLARHLLLTLTMLFGPAIVLGVATGTFYRAVPITPFASTVPQSVTQDVSPDFPLPRWSALVALVALAGLATLLSQSHRHSAHRGWLPAEGKAPAEKEPPAEGKAWAETKATWRSPAWIAQQLSKLTLTVTIVAIGLPAVIWVSAWILHQSRDYPHIGASPIASVLLTYIASLASLLWRKRTNLNSGTGGFSIPAAAPRGVIQIILVIAALTVLTAGWLLLFGGTALTVLEQNDWATVVTAGGVLLVLVILGGLVDETTLSLHPFYRRRLASAFAVRAVDRGGHVVAVPYKPAERTTLSQYGQLATEAKSEFPQIVFAASATLGDQRTPPGVNRVPYTFTGDWVGGPDIGYIRTKDLEDDSTPRLKRDLTVQGAVALSGAALAASAGGQNSLWYEPLFAVSGVRLGAWMPNPLFVIKQAQNARKWYEPGLPRVRRMSYLLRELFGIHPADGPLLQVTDGGFHDSLGLIELFRRRCTRIYCFDANGDNPPPDSTLSEVLTLAYQELGVTVELNDNVFENTPGTGTPKKPRDALTALNPRLAETGIITGKFRYPPESGRSGHDADRLIVVAKASLWADLPYPLLAYAMNNAVFPNDSTADQWFDDGQYAAYTALGRELGAEAVTAMSILAAKNTG